MIALSHGKYPLNPSEPEPHFKPLWILTLQMRCRWVDPCYVFDYQTISHVPVGASDTNLLKGQITGTAWLQLFSTCVKSRQLSFDLKFDNTLVQIETIRGPGLLDLYWSKTADAITTKRDRSDYYGKLEYRDGANWVPAPPTSHCDTIRFLAKFDQISYGLGKEHRHGFSFNLLVADPINSTNGLQEMEIDPDIKNPSV